MAAESKVSAIFIIYKDSLLAKGVETILKAGGMPVVKIDLREVGAWQKLTQAVQPGDVVVVDKRDTQVHPSLSIMQLFMNNPEISIIGLDSCENTLELYQRQLRVVKEVQELTQVIKSFSSRSQAIQG